MTPGDPRPIRDSVAALRRELGLPDPSAFDAAAAAWSDVVGESVAAHARPRHLRGGVLTVEVDDGAWAMQLRYLEAEVVTRLRAAGSLVDRVRAVVARPG